MADGTEREDGAVGRRGVRNLTLREQVFEHLREEILSNRLKPGAELNELALSNSKPEQVYSFVFAGFPLSSSERKRSP